MDARLSRWKDAEGQVWQICQICTKPTRYEDLAPSLTEGARWDVCSVCHVSEFNRAAEDLIRRLLPKFDSSMQAGFEGVFIGGEFSMGVEDLIYGLVEKRLSVTSGDIAAMQRLIAQMPRSQELLEVVTQIEVVPLS